MLIRVYVSPVDGSGVFGNTPSTTGSVTPPVDSKHHAQQQIAHEAQQQADSQAAAHAHAHAQAAHAAAHAHLSSYPCSSPLPPNNMTGGFNPHGQTPPGSPANAAQAQLAAAAAAAGQIERFGWVLFCLLPLAVEWQISEVFERNQELQNSSKLFTWGWLLTSPHMCLACSRHEITVPSCPSGQEEGDSMHFMQASQLLEQTTRPFKETVRKSEPGATSWSQICVTLSRDHLKVQSYSNPFPPRRSDTFP